MGRIAIRRTDLLLDCRRMDMTVVRYSSSHQQANQRADIRLGLLTGRSQERDVCGPDASRNCGPSASRNVPSRQNRLQRQRRLEAVLTGRNGPGRARTVANRAGTALTGAVRTGPQSELCDVRVRVFVRLSACVCLCVGVRAHRCRWSIRDDVDGR